MQKIKTGIIGFGLAGKNFHAPLVKACDEFELTTVLSSRESEVQGFDKSLTVVSSIEELLSSDVDLIINAAPNDFHYSFTKAALLKGKHVLLEKPFCNSVEEGKELIDLAKEKNLILSVFHNRRFDSDYLTIKKLIESGELGDIKQFEAHFDRYAPNLKNNWREEPGDGGGILMDLGSHLLDQALDLFGNPESVIKDTAGQRPGAQVNDYFHLILKYGEMRVILHGTSLSNHSPRYQIIGTKGRFIKYGLDVQEGQLRSGTVLPGNPNFGIEEESQWGELTIYPSLEQKKIESEIGNYLELYQNLAEAIREGKERLVVRPEQALKVVELLVGDR